MIKKEKRQFLYLSRANIESLNLDYEEINEVVAKSFAYRGKNLTDMPPKWGISTRESSFIHAMPAALKGDVNAAGIKWVSMYGMNPLIGIPATQGLIVLNDTENGTPLAVMDCSFITERRTGAAGMVGVKQLGFEDAKTIAIIGVGRVGTQHLLGSIATLPHIKHFFLYDIFPLAIENIKEKLANFKGPLPEITFSPSIEAAVKEADIILSAITMTEEIKPVIDPRWLKPKVLIIAQDYDAAFPAECFEKADEFIVDDKEQYQKTKLKGPRFAEFPLDPTADMGDILAGKYKVKEGSVRRAGLFMGIATHDIITARFVYDKAISAGIGIWLDI